tara:strand:+ start:10347 stop:11270 length:924 start_codon:yes stop_codon:yes gene_type:complete
MISIFKNSKINFISSFKLCTVLSMVMISIGILFFIFKGPQLGIDFKGGTEIIIKNNRINGDINSFKINLSKFLETNKIDVSNIKSYGNDKFQILIEDSNHNKNDIINKINSFKISDINVIGYSKIGSTISNELTRNAMQALFIAVLLIGFYIIIRFDWYSSIGSIMAIIHDILIVISLLVLFEFQFDINIIAAFLIIIGYSLNDTIVVFDRIRENLDEYSNMDLNKIINLSLNETLSRTTITSLTTLFVLLSLFIFGGSSLIGLSFALVIGIISGTYSSIFIATPIMMYLREKYYFDDEEENWKKIT